MMHRRRASGPYVQTSLKRLQRCWLEVQRAASYDSPVKDDNMQIRSKAYLQFIWLWRSLRGFIPPHDGHAPARTSSQLLYTAIVLVLLLAMLEIDRHRAELESIGLVRNGFLVDPTFVSP